MPKGGLLGGVSGRSLGIDGPRTPWQCPGVFLLKRRGRGEVVESLPASNISSSPFLPILSTRIALLHSRWGPGACIILPEILCTLGGGRKRAYVTAKEMMC